MSVARVAHPRVEGESGRTRIKQKYMPRPMPIPQWYPAEMGADGRDGCTALARRSNYSSAPERALADEEVART